MRVDWVLFVAMVAIASAAMLNYEIGYLNGKEDCYGCGLLEEALVPPILGGPWFADD
jgi:hypothetical protein